MHTWVLVPIPQTRQGMVVVGGLLVPEPPVSKPQCPLWGTVAMSDSTSSPIPEEAVRAFAREINHATHMVRTSDEASGTTSVLLPTGVTARYVFVVGGLVNTTVIIEEDIYRRGEMVNPTGALYIHVKESQSEPARMLREIDLPTYVGVLGIPQTSRDDETENVSLHLEHLMSVDKAGRNWWVRETARRTLKRIETFDDAGTEEAMLARDRYGTSLEPYLQAVVTARNVIGETTTEESRKPTEKTGAEDLPAVEADKMGPDVATDDPDGDEPEMTE